MLNFTYDSGLNRTTYRENNRKADSLVDDAFGDFLPGDQAVCGITEVNDFAGKYRISLPGQSIPFLSFFAHQVKGSVIPCKNAVFVEYSQQQAADIGLDDESILHLSNQRTFFVSRLKEPKLLAIEEGDAETLHQLCVLRPKRDQTPNKAFYKGLVVAVIPQSLTEQVTFIGAKHSASFWRQCPQLIHTMKAFDLLVKDKPSFFGYDILSHLTIDPARPLIEALVTDYKDKILPEMMEGAAARSSPSPDGSNGDQSPASLSSIPSFESYSPEIRLTQPVFRVTDTEGKEQPFFRPSSRLITTLRSNIGTLDTLAHDFVLCALFNKRQYQYPHNQTLQHEARMDFMVRKGRYEDAVSLFDSRFAHGAPAVGHLQRDEASFVNVLKQLTDFMGRIGTYGHAGDWGEEIVKLQAWVSNLRMKELGNVIAPLAAAFLQSTEEGFQCPLPSVDHTAFLDRLHINEGMQDESCNAISLDISYKVVSLLTQLNPVFQRGTLDLFFINFARFFMSEDDLSKEDVRSLYKALKADNQPYLNDVAIGFKYRLAGFWYCETLEEKNVISCLMDACQQNIKNETQFLWLLKVLAKSRVNVINLFCHFLDA